MTLADPRWLWLLAALVPLVLLEWQAGRRAERALDSLVGRRDGHALLAQRRAGQRRLGALLRLGAFALLAIGAAGPEWGREVVRRGATGSDVVLVLDVSASMDARDVPPSRLSESRREALAVLERLGGSRVGVVAFSGDAVRICPLTLERSAVRLTLESLSSSSVSTPGTDLGRALRMAMKVMPPGRREEQAIVLWTDGEDLEAGASDAVDAVAQAGIRVFAVGVGTAAGDVVPVLDEQGRAIDVKRDDSGGPVRSRLDEGLLQNVGRRTRGGYFAASRPGGELPRLLSALNTVARAARGERLVERPVARFPLLGGLALLLLLINAVRQRRRTEQEEATPLHSERGVAAAALVLVPALAIAASWNPVHAQSDWAKGNRAFVEGRWAAAESLYQRRLEKGAPAAVRVNLATARALNGKGPDAARALNQLAAPDDESGRAAGYNLGTLLGEQNEIDPALEELRRSLERDPGDEDARWNYEVLMRRKREQEQQSPQPDPQSQQQDQQQEPQPDNPQPSRPSGGQDQSPSQPRPASPSPQQPPQSAPHQPQTMDRAQAERLLGALEELQRLERQRQRRVRVVQEKRGKDW